MAEYPEQLEHGSGATLTLEPGLAVVSVRPSLAADAGTVDELLASAELIPVAEEFTPPTAAGARPMSQINDSDQLRWVRLQSPRALPTAAADMQAQLGERVEWIGAVYRVSGVAGYEGLVSPLPHVLLIRPEEGASDTDFMQRMAARGLVEDEARSTYTAPFRYFLISEPSQQNAYELRDVLRDEVDLVEDVRFETMPMLVPTTLTPNDPLFSQQWGVQRIDASTAWDTTTGDASLVVCILDEGCDLTHPDLRFSDPGINLGTMQPDGRPTGNHGTACAGIAAAVLGNNTGVAGVAGACAILPLAFQNWTDAECAAGIRYAADHNASVISMSFGVYGPGEGVGPTGWDFTIINPALEYAHNRDVVLCAATGNENISTFNRYPSRHQLVIACGASSEDDNRKSTTSPDGENWWGSNFAPGVSVVAPGVHIQTTDRQGAAGYNTSAGIAGDYFATFNGTSSATPHVAGLAALVKSRDPSLPAIAVRDIIEQSADKVGTVPYANQAGFPNGTRNDEMGYGRINASSALRMAEPAAKIKGKDIALVRQTPGWGSIPVAFAQGDGTWQITNGAAPNFIPSWAPTPGVRIVNGDFR
jgi:subtilisin family serine protease